MCGALRKDARERVGERKLGVACELEDRIDLRPTHGGLAELAPQARRKNQLPLGTRADESLSGGAGAVAQARTSGPEIDTCRFRLGRVFFPLRRRPFRPAPRPDG